MGGALGSGGWRWPLLVLPAAVALATIPDSMDRESDIKTLLIAVTLAWSACVLTFRGLRRAEWRRLGAPGIAAGVFLAIAAVSALTSDQPVLSFIGGSHRHNGLLAYTLAVALLAVVVLALDAWGLAVCARALALGGAVSVAYWLLQLAGLDPLGIKPLPHQYSSTRLFASTLGNPNFAGAFLAAALPAGLWALLRPGLKVRDRLLWGAVTALLAAGVVGSGSLQAPLAAAAGVGVYTLVMITGRKPRAAAGLAALGAVAVVVLALGLAQRGPLSALGAQDTFVSRTWDWTAATRMVADRPLTGVGLGRYGGHLRAYRPPDQIRADGWAAYSDAPHNVPLEMAAGGGVPLAVAYLAFIGLVGARVLRGLRTLSGPPLALLAAFAGAWAAYHAQSLVSIDVAQLWFLHFLSAGAILALTAPPAEPAPAPRARRDPAIATAATAGIAVLALLPVLWLGRQTAADWQAGRSSLRLSAGDLPGALELSDASLRLFPWEATQWWIHASLLAQAGAGHEALQAALEAVAHNPREAYYLAEAATLAQRAGRLDLAARLLDDALRFEPQAAEVKARAAAVAIEQGESDRARRLLDAALAFDPDNAEARKVRDQLLSRSKPQG